MGERARTLVVDSYDIELEIDDSDAETFRSRTTIRFSSTETAAYADLAATTVESAFLNGRPLDIARTWDGSVLRLAGLESTNVLEVAGLFPYAVDKRRGLRRASDLDGSGYLYNINYPAATPRVFCCFDDRELRARINLRLSVPTGWTSLVNGSTARFAPFLAAGAAGPWARLHHTTAGTVPVTVHAQRARAAERNRGRDIANLMARSITRFEHQLGVPYPYEKCDAVFVRDLPPLAISTPGLILFNDKVLDRIEDRGPRYAVTVIGHEIAHAWIGCLVDDRDETAWLDEACATYLARTAVLDPGAGQRAVDAGRPAVAGRRLRATGRTDPGTRAGDRPRERPARTGRLLPALCPPHRRPGRTRGLLVGGQWPRPHRLGHPVTSPWCPGAGGRARRSWTACPRRWPGGRPRTVWSR